MTRKRSSSGGEKVFCRWDWITLLQGCAVARIDLGLPGQAASVQMKPGRSHIECPDSGGSGVPFLGFSIPLGPFGFRLRWSFEVTVGSPSCCLCQCWNYINDVESHTDEVINGLPKVPICRHYIYIGLPKSGCRGVKSPVKNCIRERSC